MSISKEKFIKIIKEDNNSFELANLNPNQLTQLQNTINQVQVIKKTEQDLGLNKQQEGVDVSKDITKDEFYLGQIDKILGNIKDDPYGVIPFISNILSKANNTNNPIERTNLIKKAYLNLLNMLHQRKLEESLVYKKIMPIIAEAEPPRIKKKDLKEYLNKKR